MRYYVFNGKLRFEVMIICEHLFICVLKRFTSVGNIYNRRENQEEEYIKQIMLDIGIVPYKELMEVATDGEVRRDIFAP